MPKKKKTEAKIDVSTLESVGEVVVVTGHSESGDDYGPWVFTKKPSDEFMKAFLKEYAAGDFEDDEDGPGDYGSYVHLRYHSCTIDKIP